MIKRNIEEKLAKEINTRTKGLPNNVIIIEGARQTGKTSVVENILQKQERVLKINLERDEELCLKIDQTAKFEDFQLLLENNLGLDILQEQILFVDEAQESSKLGSFIRFMKEEWVNTKVILTGSSMSRLFRKQQRIPVGRYIKYLVTPFSFKEFLLIQEKNALINLIENFNSKKELSIIAHNELLQEMSNYIEVGGMPEVSTYYANKLDWKKLRESILYSQIDDFIRKSDFEQPVDFMEALKAIANNLGFPSKYSQIQTDYRSAKKLTQQLIDWHLVHEIEQKGNSSTTNFFPKRYIYDLGIAQSIRNMPFPAINSINSTNNLIRTQLGGIFENLVLNQLTSHQVELSNIKGWKKNSQAGVEVDFIIQNDLPIPIEVKVSRKIGINNFKPIVDYLNAAQLKVGMIISNDVFKVLKKDSLTLINLPIYMAEPGIIKRLLLS